MDHSLEFGGMVGAFGLGGGVVFNPLLLGLGVLPQVTTATAMYMILFGTTASTFTKNKSYAI